MEKKRTKIAYFTAVGVFLVLLVVLGLTYRETPLPTLEVEGEPVLADTPFAGTFWSLLPPIVAIVLALISKEVYSSLFLGCLVGALLYAQFAPWDTIVALVGADYGIVSVLADSGNMGIIVFLVTLGIMVDLMNKGGGSEAFGRWASKTVKTRCAAQLLTMLLGVLIFVDDYFNCLTVGAVMRHREPQNFPCQAGLPHRRHGGPGVHDRPSVLVGGGGIRLCAVRRRQRHRDVHQADPVELLLSADVGDDRGAVSDEHRLRLHADP